MKRKDPTIYQSSTTFFEEDNFDTEPSEPKKKAKKLTIKQYEQDILMKNGGAFDEEDINEDKRPQSPTYNEEQKIIRDDILKIGKIDGSEDEDDNDIGGLFSKREKSQKEQVCDQQKRFFLYGFNFNKNGIIFRTKMTKSRKNGLMSMRN